ncbi:nitrous oxide reductase family maturation protein NosD [Candidatus Bipolaricaulota bacterium]
MNTNRWRRPIGALLGVCFVVVLGSALTSVPGISGEDASNNTPGQMESDRLVGMMSEIVDPIREAYYVAAQGCNAETADALNVSAQATLNMIEGSSSPLFIDTLEIPLYVTGGIRPVVDSFAFTEGWFDPEVTSNMEKRQLEKGFADVQDHLHTASELLQELLADSSSFSENRSNIETVCLLLDSLEIVIEGFLKQYGYEIHLRAGDSVQEAIDGARDGAVIYLWPTTYTESLDISKNITLDGSNVNANPLLAATWLQYGSAISTEGSGEVGVLIRSEEPIHVTIRQLMIRSTTEAISVSGDADVVLEDVTIRDAGTAIRIFDGGHVQMSKCLFELNDYVVNVSEGGSIVGINCTFSDNRQAVSATSSSSCTLIDSVIERSGLPEDDESMTAGVVTAYCSDLVLERCIVRDNYGSGVTLGGGEASTLHMTDCQVTNNGLGLHLEYGDCNPTGDPNSQSTGHSHGTTSGWDNHIPGPDEAGGNRSGAFWYCCDPELDSDPSFLLAPRSGNR